MFEIEPGRPKFVTLVLSMSLIRVQNFSSIGRFKITPGIPLKSLPFRDGEKVYVKLSKRHPTVTGVVKQYLGGTRYAVSIEGVIREPHINQMTRCPN